MTAVYEKFTPKFYTKMHSIRVHLTAHGETIYKKYIAKMRTILLFFVGVFYKITLLKDLKIKNRLSFAVKKQEKNDL